VRHRRGRHNLGAGKRGQFRGGAGGGNGLGVGGGGRGVLGHRCGISRDAKVEDKLVGEHKRGGLRADLHVRTFVPNKQRGLRVHGPGCVLTRCEWAKR